MEIVQSAGFWQIGAVIGLWVLSFLVGLCVKFLWNINWRTKSLYDVHLGPNAIDEDGAPKWYVRKALDENVASLAEAISSLKEVLRDLHNDQKTIQQSLKRIEKRVDQ